jgi:hypothetical protein
MEFVHVTWRNIVLDGVGKEFRRPERQRHSGGILPYFDSIDRLPRNIQFFNQFGLRPVSFCTQDF